MTLTRAALYVGVASVVGVWLSSVASSMSQDGRRAAAVDAAAEITVLPTDLQEQSRQLRQRLAAGPPPPQPVRNPFEFTTERPAVHPGPAARAPALPPFQPFPPATAERELSLIGVAIHQRADAAVHTAVLATIEGELIMAVTGDTVLDRFRVTGVGADTVELLEPATGASVRLRLVP